MNSNNKKAGIASLCKKASKMTAEEKYASLSGLVVQLMHHEQKISAEEALKMIFDLMGVLEKYA